MYSNKNARALREPFRTFNSGVLYSLRIAGMAVNGPQVSATIAGGQLLSTSREQSLLTNRDRAAHPTLSLLHLKIGEKDAEDVLGTNSLRDVAE